MKNNIVTVNYAGGESHTFNHKSDMSDIEILECIFAMFNHGSGGECDLFKRKKMRSLSVNDFVRLNGQWYQCCGIGWNKVSNEFVDEIEAAVVAHPLFETEGEWYALQMVMRDKKVLKGDFGC